MKSKPNFILTFLVLVTLLTSSTVLVHAGDHADGTTVASDAGADLGGLYFFLDPNDNTKAVIIATLHGFIVPAQAVNAAVFDPTVRLRFFIENTGDGFPDRQIFVTFSRQTFSSVGQPLPQQVTVSFFRGPRGVVRAETTVATLGAVPPAPSIGTGAFQGGQAIDVSAGLFDDPFFFDQPAFESFAASVRGGAPSAAELTRGRDTFAGYNTLAVALRLPVTELRRSSAATVVGLCAITERRSAEANTIFGDRIGLRSAGWRMIDRTGNPCVNLFMLPRNLWNRYNAANPVYDLARRNPFRSAMIQHLTTLGTNETNRGALLSQVVTTGDYLRLETNPTLEPNSGPGGGNNPGAGYPNGRRLGDDVVDTLIGTITNGTVPTGDMVNANDVPFIDQFPFLAPPHTRRAAGTLDDGTRN